MMKEIRQRRVVSLLPPRLHVVIVNIFVLFMCTSHSHAQIINSTTAPPSSSTTSTSRPSSSSTTLPSGVTTIPLPSSTFKYLTLYQYVSNRGGTQLSYSGAISPGAKMIFQVDVSLVQQFVVFNLSYPFQNNIQMNLWKAYNLTSLTGIPYPYNTSSLPPLQGIWSSSPTPSSDFNVPGSFLVLKPKTPGVKDMCALAHSVTVPCTFFLELTNMNTTGSTNYVLDLMIGLMLSFNAGADIAASNYDPTHTQFSPLPFQLPFPGSLPPNILGIYGFEIAAADLDVFITMAPSPNIPNNYLFQLAVTVAESDPFVNQLTVASNQAPNSAVQVDVNGGPGFQEGLYIFLVYVGVTPPYDNTLMTTFQFTAITGYNPDSYFGLSMFGIVGALTVLVLCLFSAAAVIARRRRAADIRAYGTAGVQMENRPPPGASEEQISLLETQVYKKGGGTITDEDAKCAVCLCDYEENDRLKMLPCKHHFHTTCVTTWLKQRKHCPLCQQDIENAHDVKKPGSDRPLSPPVSATAVQPVVDGFPPHVVPDASALDASPNPRSSSSSTSASGSDSSLASSASSVASIMALPQAHLQLVRPPAVSVTSQTRVLPVNSAHVTLTVGSGDDGKRS